MIYDNYIFQYHKAIKTGEIIAGKHIKRIYAIITEKIMTGEWLYDDTPACKAVFFVENFCRHSKGRDDLIKLELWQKALLASIFGIMGKDGNRQFNECVVIVARKNGKSLLAAAIMAYMAFCDNEYGAEIYSIAPKLKQAKISFNNLHQIVVNDPELKALARKRRDDIYIKETVTSIEPIAFNSKKSDGFNPHLVVCDEIASWQGDSGLKQYEVLSSGTGSREQPLILSISTAGYVRDSIYDELIGRSLSFLNGGSLETGLLPFLYTVDDEERWDDFLELEKSNPLLSASPTLHKFYKKQIPIAQRSPSKKAEFLTKYCNIKQNSSTAWLEYKHVQKALELGAGKSLDDFRGCYCTGGFDLSTSIDLTAACICIEKDGVIYLFVQFFLPKERVSKALEAEGTDYQPYIDAGILTVCGENQIDPHFVSDWFINVKREYDLYVLKIGYDRWNAPYLVSRLNAAGFECEPVKQGQNLTPVIREFEGDLLDEKIAIAGDNHLLAAHMLNTALKHAGDGAIAPIKLDTKSHIDGFAASLDALTVRQKYYAEFGDWLKNVS